MEEKNENVKHGLILGLAAMLIVFLFVPLPFHFYLAGISFGLFCLAARWIIYDDFISAYLHVMGLLSIVLSIVYLLFGVSMVI